MGIKWEVDEEKNVWVATLTPPDVTPTYLELAIAYKNLCRDFSDSGGCPFGSLHYKSCCVYQVRDCKNCIEKEYLNQAERFLKGRKENE